MKAKLVRESLIENERDLYECPHCGETLDDDELGSVPDEGCPYCRKMFDPTEAELVRESLNETI